MSFPVESFWRLVVEAQLLSLDDCHKHHAAWMQANPQGGDARQLAEFLVATNILSKYQASILLAGRAGPFVYGDYCIYDRIESGRLAGIFRAYHTATGHRVCLQFLTGEQAGNPEVTAFLAQRAALVSRSSAGFPYLLRCYHLADHGAFKFFVLEDLQGKRIERILQQQGPMKAGEACRVVRQAALGLGRLHAMQQAHGDVRPANIWVDASGTVKMLQFPLSRDPMAPPIDWRTVLNSPNAAMPIEADYVAPEMLTGSPADARSDVYQLGCSLYQMLTNRPPFRAETLREKIEGHLKGSPAPIEKLNPAVPPELAKVVGYMMQKKPDMRFQQMSSIVEKLLPFMSQAEAESRPVPPTRMAVAYDAWLEGVLSGGAAYGGAPPAAAAQSGAFGQPAAPAPAPFGAAPMAAAGPPASRPAGARPAAGPRGQATSSDALAERIRRRKQQSTRNMIAAGVVLLILGGLGFVFRKELGKLFESKPQVADTSTEEDTKPKPSGSAEAVPTATATATAPPPVDPALAKRDLVASSNPEGIYASPTAGKPITLEHMMPGIEMIVSLKPSQLYGGEDGAGDPTMLRPELQILLDPKASGSLGPWLTTTLPSIAGTTNDKIDQVVIGFAAGPSVEAASVGCVIRLKEAIPEDTLVAAWGNPEVQQQGALKAYVKDGVARYLPASGEGKLIVVAPADKLPDLEKHAGIAPRLSNEFEGLLGATDADRDFTVMYTPYFLESGGRSLVSPAVQKGMPALTWLFTGAGLASASGDMAAPPTEEMPKAVAFSAHLTKENGWYYELRTYAVAASNTSETAAEGLEKRVKELPTRVKDYIFAATLSDYGKQLVNRLPDMVKFAAKHVRVGSADKHLVLNGYLPPTGGLSLACGVYTCLLEASKGAMPAATAVATGTAAAGSGKPATAAEAIKKPMALTFDRNNLEVTMQLIAEEIGIPIEILGSDLQLDGITKNQSFALDEKMQPADELLRKIMLKANPDGKLVYILKPKNPGEPDMIFITTRAAVEKRKDKLPPELVK